jgi:hypothetical protein
MAGIPSPLEMDCGQLSYVGLGCSYDENRENLIPCVRVLKIAHAHDMHDHLIYDLNFSICLGVEGHGFGELVVQ